MGLFVHILFQPSVELLSGWFKISQVLCWQIIPNPNWTMLLVKEWLLAEFQFQISLVQISYLLFTSHDTTCLPARGTPLFVFVACIAWCTFMCTHCAMPQPCCWASWWCYIGGKIVQCSGKTEFLLYVSTETWAGLLCSHRRLRVFTQWESVVVTLKEADT